MDTQARVQAEIAAARERGAARVAELNVLVKKELDVLDQEKRERFEKHLAWVGVPTWAHEYATGCDYDDNQFTVALPGCAPIHYTADGFHISQPLSIDYDEQWYVQTQGAYLMESRSWDEAIFLASKYGETYMGLLAETAGRNERGAKPATKPSAAERHLKMALKADPADHVLATIDEIPGGSFESGMLWAALAIGAELRGIRTAVEDIAANMLAPVADDKVSE